MSIATTSLKLIRPASPRHLKTTLGCQPSSLSCSSTVRNGSSQSSSSSSTIGCPRSCTPLDSQHLKASGSLARRAATSSPIRNRAMRVSSVVTALSVPRSAQALKNPAKRAGLSVNQARFSCSAVQGEVPSFMVPSGQVVLFHITLSNTE